MSVTLWLIWLNRPVAIVWIAAAASGIILGLGLMDALFGSEAFIDILASSPDFPGSSADAFDQPAGFPAAGRRDRLHKAFTTTHLETMIAVCLGVGPALAPAFGWTIRWRR